MISHYATLREGAKPAPDYVTPPGLRKHAAPGVEVHIDLEAVCIAPQQNTLQETLTLVGEIVWNTKQGHGPDDSEWVSFTPRLTELATNNRGFTVILRTAEQEAKAWCSHGKQ